MAKIPFLLGLTLLSRIVAVEIDDVFTVHPGPRDGGCDEQLGTLDQWLSEAIESVDTALLAIDDYNQDIRVRRSMSIFFGIANSGRLGSTGARVNAVAGVRANIEYIQSFFNHRINEETGVAHYNRDDYWLFCHSEFLSLQEPSWPALDYLAQEIRDQDDNQVPIMNIPDYAARLGEDPNNRPWWSGELTTLNGYYFSDTGASYCYDTELGLTAAIQPLRRGVDGQAENANPIASIILCPYSFDGSPRADSYRDANNLIHAGTNLADAVPKSATLLHEGFHAIFGAGDEGFLEDTEELYDIAACINVVSSDVTRARRNPENYIFFIAHMFHMRGEEEGEEPWSIHTQWDFQLQGLGQNRVMGAFHPPQ
ncbi:hypothetical protein EKO27_g1887 [Xylaria grammica]|uniref:Lysine-specific metallo-endopeptidase domain-containing protein n=1 Tax=Xylaria grammica TaxID=363999 RepID=A0A439DFL8_9PEZI|nr:hypothetical protein EKO27_g1887 [Xylaria grammica]